jgi:hypothetical protein
LGRRLKKAPSDAFWQIALLYPVAREVVRIGVPDPVAEI